MGVFFVDKQISESSNRSRFIFFYSLWILLLKINKIRYKILFQVNSSFGRVSDRLLPKPSKKRGNRGRGSSDNQWGEGHGQDRGGKEGQGRRGLDQSHTTESHDSDCD